MAFIDKQYDRKCLSRRWAKDKTGDTCCLCCRRPYPPKRSDRHKNHRRK